MRIGVLTTSFPRTPEDISGAFVLGFAQALAALGHELEVLAPEPSERVAPPQHPGVHTAFVPYLRPRTLQRTFYGAGVPDNLKRDPRAALGLVPFPLALGRACARRARHWDALVSHWALPCALLAGRIRGERPHLAVLHSADVHLLTRLPLRHVLASRIARQATTLWFVAPQHRDTFLALLPSRQRDAAAAKVFVSPMGIAPPSAASGERHELRARLGLDRFTVLALGRLLPIKGLDVALEALAGSGMTLLLAGDGPERARLRARAEALGVDARLLGTVTGQAKADLLRAVDAFVTPSRVLPDGRGEGVPTALLEAMSYGLPVVATDTGGISSVVQPGQTGLLVPPADPRALSSALAALRDDRDFGRRLAAAGQQRTLGQLWPALGRKAEAFLQ